MDDRPRWMKKENLEQAIRLSENERSTGINFNEFYWMGRRRSLEVEVIQILSEIFPSVF